MAGLGAGEEVNVLAGGDGDGAVRVVIEAGVELA